MTFETLVYEPKVKVTLFKTVKRSSLGGKAVTSSRFQGAVGQRAVDLTAFLGDGSSVHTGKSVRDPAGGFQVTLQDSPYFYAGQLESLYGLIEPMDMIEIRMRHALTGTGDPPVVMRGFVSEVSRAEGMGSDGRPSRTVSISGQDYGKIWQIMRIIFYADFLLGEDYISEFRLFEKFGVGFETSLPVTKFVTQVFDKCINPFLQKMLPEGFPLPREIKTTSIAGVEGTTSPGIQSMQGTFYQLMHSFGDVGAWNELFIEDRDDGVYVVFRPNPYLTASDDIPKKIQSTAPDPVYVDIGAEDIVSISVSRSDNNVSNYYWVGAPRFEGADDVMLRQWAVTSAEKSTVVFADYANSQEKLYGTRVMDVNTMLGEPAMTTHNTDGDAQAVDKQSTSMVSWVSARRKALVEQNKDNVLFESGSMRLRGNEAIKAGVHLRVKRGNSTAIYYAVSVSHEFMPFQGYFTSVQFERGTGFINRVKAGGSPYLNELVQK